MRNTDSVQGPIPLMPARASSHGSPCCTLPRISSDLCRIAMQHSARRLGRPIARRLAISGSVAGDGVVICGCADLTRSARRHATRVEICCARTMRRSPQMGSSVGRAGQRASCAAMTRPSAGSRTVRCCSAGLSIELLLVLATFLPGFFVVLGHDIKNASFPLVN